MEKTITEALAEIKVIGKRITSKDDALQNALVRSSDKIDPHEANGGSTAYVASLKQGIKALTDNIVAIRTAILKKNCEETITVAGVTKTISEWLVWKREVYPVLSSLYNGMQNRIRRADSDMDSYGRMSQGEDKKSAIINADIQALNNDAEQIAACYEQLDGQLSLKNATLMVDIPE